MMRSERVISKRGVLPLETFQTLINVDLVVSFNVLRLAAATMKLFDSTRLAVAAPVAFSGATVSEAC